MTSYNYSYNVLINRLEAFAAGHFLIRRFTHGQIDMSDTLQDDQYPFMHVTPDTIEPVPGAMNFGFHIMFADIPRDKEYKAEYQREVISDCIRLGQDLIAEVKNGLELFGFDVQLLETPTFEPFMEEQKNTVTGVAFTLKLSVPWDWSACDIPAIWSVGGASGTGGEGTGYGITLRTNGVDNVVQTLLDLVEGTNITITDLGNGQVQIDSTGGGGGGGEFVSTEYNANHTTATGNQYVVGDRVWYNGNVYRCIANNDALLPTNTTYWTLVAVGYRLRQSPVDWNATSGDYQILNKPTIPAAQVNSDWNAVSGLAQILNKPFIPVNIDDLADVSAAAPANFNSLYYLGGVWKSGFIALDWLQDVTVPTPSNGQVLTFDSATGVWIAATPSGGGGGTVNSVALSMPAPANPAFSVAGSPVTNTGTLAVSANGTIDQYVDGTGALRTMPLTSGGGSSVSYYLNGSINQGTIGGSTYYQMSKTAVFGAGTDFTRTNAQGNGLIAQFITDANDPNVLLVPGGNFNLELYFSASSSGGTPSFYVELYKYDGATFTLLATDVATPEGITQGTVIDAYFTALAVPPTTMALTDRLAMRVFVTTSGRTLKLHTENSHLSQVITTLSTGVNAINGLTAQVQNFAVGTAGADFGISSVGSTHTFNLPTASAANRGLLSTTDWLAFNGKQNNIGLTTVGNALATLPNPSAIRYVRINADNTATAISAATLKTELGGKQLAFKTADQSSNILAFADVTDLSFSVVAGRTYKFKIFCQFDVTNTSTGTRWAVNGPAFTRLFYSVLWTSGSGTGTQANVAYQTYDATGSTGSSNFTTNNCAIIEGIVVPSANGTLSARFANELTVTSVTCKAGSYIEFEEI
jgi:hypothetical protein